MPRRRLPLVLAACAALLEPAAARSAAKADKVSTLYQAYPGLPGGGPETVSVTVSHGADGLRTFALTSTAQQRGNASGQRSITETADTPRLLTASPMFDALFAIAIDDLRQDSVEAISDANYDGGQPIPCHCFQTGADWPYVWTRDLSYALDLGLAGFDASRGADGLVFKTSGFRPGITLPPELPPGTQQIVQDTGSGGSWPVSTDRVAWALGAEAVLGEIAGPDRAAFATRALAALSGTLEADRVAAYDPRDGLYGGEQSFLDWREQSYPTWIVDHLSDMAQSKALSTNIDEYRAMRLAAVLEREAGQVDVAQRYDGWADGLAAAIQDRFWDNAAGLYATYTSSGLQAGAISRYDLLGNMLAIDSGIANAARARAIVANYPFAPFGPPVEWPESPDIEVYHNRAIWPFATAYMLRAAAQAENVAAADRALDSLMRGAALNLTNMENLEWLSGTATFLGGPKVDSRRQLWSAAGYYGAIVRTVFGWQPGIEGVRIAPFLTTTTRALMGNATTARIAGLHYRGAPVDLVLHLPPVAAPGGYYALGQVTLNGRPVSGHVAATFRSTGNIVEVRFGEVLPGEGKLREVPLIPVTSSDDPRAFLPRTPGPVRLIRNGATVGIGISPNRPPAGVIYRIWRDGLAIADHVRGTAWIDPDPPEVTETACYAVQAVDPATGFASLPSLPVCLRGSIAQTIAVTDPRVSADRGVLPPGDGVAEPTVPLALGTHLFVRDIAIARPGLYAVTLRYDNHQADAKTGITNAVKRLTIVDAEGTRLNAIVQMPEVPEIDGQHPLRSSTRALFALAPGTYRIEMGDFFNMSMLAANAPYSGAGGSDGPVNEARIAAVQIDQMRGQP